MTTLDDLQKALLGEPETPPKNFYTVRELADKWSMSTQKARRLVLAGVDKKILQTKDVRILTGRGLYPTPHYGPVKG